MIISRTPFRISFLGGGTDYPDWYRSNGGAVLSVTINKYSYVTCRFLPPFFDYKYLIRYFQREETNSIAEIQHPSVRECLSFMEINDCIEIVHHADLPARSGLGSSSTFTVGLLHSLSALKNKMANKRELAINAIHVEQNIIKENVGSQDQTAAAFGGFNQINFGGINEIEVRQLIIESDRYKEFENSLMLFFTGFSRTASEIACEQIKEIPNHTSDLQSMKLMVDEGIDILTGNTPLKEFGFLLDRQWKIKRKFSTKITNTMIDNIYSTGIKSGALGGKLLGAGGGGFMLFFVPPEFQSQVKSALSNLLYVPCRFDTLGGQIGYAARED